MIHDVAVVGGGLSGLAAAVRLTLDGAKVALIEQANKLGGRAYSYVDKKTGDVVDNGQHVLVGTYRNALKYLELIGTRHLLSSPASFELHFLDKAKRFSTFTIPSLPHPLNIILAIARFDLLSRHDKIGLLLAGLTMKVWNSDFEKRLSAMTITQWFDSLNLSETARQNFLYPIAVSVMNELPQKASALLFARSLRQTFFAERKDLRLLIPAVGQSELYVDRAVTLMGNRGSRVLTGSEAVSFVIDRHRATGVKLASGERVAAKTIICSIPPFALARIVPDRFKEIAPFCHLGQFASSPIVSVHLWFDRAVMDKEFVGLIGRNVQWVFNRRPILKDLRKPENYVSGVISGAYQYVNMSREKLAEMVRHDLASAFPQARKAKVVHSVVIKEKRATYSPTNNVEPLRPGAQTPIQNLLLAGDWTNTGLPPTIESAVMSGFHCAELARTS